MTPLALKQNKAETIAKSHLIPGTNIGLLPSALFDNFIIGH
jgi:hypothetical protein